MFGSGRAFIPEREPTCIPQLVERLVEGVEGFLPLPCLFLSWLLLLLFLFFFLFFFISFMPDLLVLVFFFFLVLGFFVVRLLPWVREREAGMSGSPLKMDMGLSCCLVSASSWFDRINERVVSCSAWYTGTVQSSIARKKDDSIRSAIWKRSLAFNMARINKFSIRNSYSSGDGLMHTRISCIKGRREVEKLVSGGLDW